MSYIDRNLLAGEEVVFRTRLHWKLLVGPLLFAIASLVAVIWVLTQGTWNSLILIVPALGLFVLLAALIKGQSSDFAVTNKRVLMKVGVSAPARSSSCSARSNPCIRAWVVEYLATATS